MNFESLSHSARTILLTRIAHLLTVCARSTYEPGTENIAEPRVLRGYNELMHRVTSCISMHVEGDKTFPLEEIIKMMEDFGRTFDQTNEIGWVLKSAQERPLPMAH